MSYKITEIEGIGPANAEKLTAAQISTTEDLLKHCCDKKGRDTISEQTGIGASQLLSWANKADLMRIKGIGEEYSDLLEAAGVDTVKELATRNAENLTQKTAEVNVEKNCCRSLPNQDTINSWIEEAKTTEPLITH